MVKAKVKVTQKHSRFSLKCIGEIFQIVIPAKNLKILKSQMNMSQLHAMLFKSIYLDVIVLITPGKKTLVLVN